MMRLFVAFALLQLGFAVIHKFPITYKPSLRMKLIKEGKIEEYMKQRQVISVDASASTNIIDYEDMAYMTQITLGTPAQNFVVFLDSGSGNLWVPDSTCIGSDTPACGKYCAQVPQDSCLTFCLPSCCTNNRKKRSTNTCASKHLFNSTASSSYKSQPGTFEITYSTGPVSGFFGQDKFCLSGTSLCVNNQVFGQATSIGGSFSSQPEDGIIGLGWQALAVDAVMPPMFNFLNQGLLDQPVFVVYMGGIGPTSALNGGQLTVGAMDTTNCGTPNYIPLTSITYWQFKMSGVSAGSYANTPNSGWQAISDTASTFIGGPSAVIKALAQSVGAHSLTANSGYFIDCDAAGPDVVFTINGQNYHVTRKNYILPMEPGLCMFAFFPQDNGGFGPAWMLGPPLIREYCQIHDMQNARIGMAPVLH